MNIYTNGCSHTSGSGYNLKDPKNSWPHIIANHYQAQLINDAKAGMSNDHIFRTSMEHITSAPVPPDKVIIQWTYHERLELWHHDHEGNWVDWQRYIPSSWIRDNRPNGPYDNMYEFMRSITDRLDSRGKTDEDKHRSCISPISHKLLNYMYSLECVLKEMGVEDYTFLVWSPVDSSYNTYKWLNKNNYIFNLDHHLNELDLPKCEVINSRGFVDGHYMEESHNQIANWIIDGYRSEESGHLDMGNIYSYT